jgi:hypothetical protein
MAKKGTHNKDFQQINGHSQVDEMPNRLASRASTGLDANPRLRSREILQGGVTSVAGAARLAIAAAEDMVSGSLTPQEATVLNTTAGRVLKATELYLKYARAENPQLRLPNS